MFRILFLVSVLVNSQMAFILPEDCERSPIETQCPDALERFTDAALRYTSKALKVYADSTNESGSLSPISSMFLLATLAVYSSGNSKYEAYKILNLWNTEEIMCVTDKLNNEARNITGCAEFRAAPCIFADHRYDFTPAYKNSVYMMTFDGVARNYDYFEMGNAINHKIAQRTGNRILTAAPDYSIFNSSTELVPVSAMYLAGGWEIEFKKTSELTHFRISPTESELQTFMYQDAEYNYAHSDTLCAKVVQVNMCIDDLSLWILLPDCPFTESALVAKMAENPYWYYDLKEIMTPTRLDLSIPKFGEIATVDSEYIMKKATGLKTVFDKKNIKIKGVIECDEEVAISAGVQTTYFKTSFHGNSIPECSKGPKKTFKADYPFAYMVFRYNRAYLGGIFRKAVA